MDYNKFEDRISRWIENDMDVKERREFEKFLSEHPEYQLKVDEVRNAISTMNQAPDLKVSSCLLYTSPSPRDATLSRMPSSA